jgi:hypothetical protein
MTLAVVAGACRRLGLTGQGRGGDEPGEEHGSRGDRQRRRQMEAEPHVIALLRGRMTRHSGAGATIESRAGSVGLQSYIGPDCAVAQTSAVPGRPA